MGSMIRTDSHLLVWLTDCTRGPKGSIEARKLLDLISIIDDPDSYPPPSHQYTFYSDQVTRVMSEISAVADARRFVQDLYILSQATLVPGVAVYYPPLREYVKHFRKTPELLVTLYAYCDAVPPEEDGAGEWLIQADRLDPNNEYVLWQRLLSRGEPWFPEQLIYSSDIVEEEKWLVSKLLQLNPVNPLVLGVQSRLEKSGQPLYATENIGFWNSLNRLAPLPMIHMSLTLMLELSERPRPHRRPSSDAKIVE